MALNQATPQQQLRGVSHHWTSVNPTLKAGEIGYETDTGNFKIGDGSTAWNSLSYFSNTVEGTAVLSTGEVGGTKFLREDGDGTCSWQDVSGALIPASDTGTAITFTENTLYNEVTYLTSGNLTLSLTGAVKGTYAIVYCYNYIPTISGASYTTASGQLSASNLNILCFFYNGTEIFLNIGGGATTSQTDFISGLIPTPADQTYKLVVKAPYAGTINSTTTICTSGTCTATFKINTTALGGTANSVSSTEESQAHASANDFVAGDDIQLTVSATSTCVDMSFTIEFTKTLS